MDTASSQFMILSARSIIPYCFAWSANMYQAYGWHTVPLTTDVISEKARPWLTYSGNLTEQMRQQSVPHRLRLWRQGLEQIPIHEQLLLKQALPGVGWVRQIYHVLGSDIVMYGRTVMPESIYLKYQDVLDNLGTKPIGEHFLYGGDWPRSQYTFGCVTPAGLLHEGATQGEQKQGSNAIEDAILPARRSVFGKGTDLILLTEVFLPAVYAFFPVENAVVA